MVKRVNKRIPPEGFIANQFKKGEERTKELGRKGGKNKSLWALIRLRKKCSPKCPIYERCPFAHIAIKQEGKPCLLNKWNKQDAKRLVQIIEKEEEGINETISTLMAYIYMEIMLKHRENIDLKRKLLYDLISIKKSIFGEKRDVKLEADMKIDMEAILNEIKKTIKVEEED